MRDAICFVISVSVVIIWLYNVLLVKNNWSVLIFLTSLGTTVYFGIRLFKFIQQNPYDPKNHSNFILNVKKEMDNLGVNSIKIIDDLISEMDIEISRLGENEKNLSSTVSKFFFWVVWAPLAFLTKYIIENKILDIQTPEDYFQIVGFLLAFFLICLVLLLSNTNPFETTNYFRKTTIKQAKQALIDIRYLYNEETKIALNKINNQATADAAP